MGGKPIAVLECPEGDGEDSGMRLGSDKTTPGGRGRRATQNLPRGGGDVTSPKGHPSKGITLDENECWDDCFWDGVFDLDSARHSFLWRGQSLR